MSSRYSASHSSRSLRRRSEGVHEVSDRQKDEGQDAPAQASEPSNFVAVTAHCCELHSVHWSAVSRASGFDTARPCNQILSLDLGGNLISDLAGMECYPWLLSLSLAQNDLRSLESKRLPFTLTHLNLSHNVLTNLDGIEALPHLAWLDASHNVIETVQALSTSFRLKELRLGNNNIVSLEGLEGLWDLALLELHDNLISNEQEIRSLTPLSQLTTMTLARNPIFNRPKRLRSLCIDLLPGLMSLDGVRIGRVATCRKLVNRYAVLNSAGAHKKGGRAVSLPLPPLFAHLPPNAMLLPQHRNARLTRVRPGTLDHLESLLHESAAAKGLEWVMQASANMFRAQPPEPPPQKVNSMPAQDCSWRKEAAEAKHLKRQQEAKHRRQQEVEGRRGASPESTAHAAPQPAFAPRCPFNRQNPDLKPWRFMPSFKFENNETAPQPEVLRGLASGRCPQRPPPQMDQASLFKPVSTFELAENRATSHVKFAEEERARRHCMVTPYDRPAVAENGPAFVATTPRSSSSKTYSWHDRLWENDERSSDTTRVYDAAQRPRSAATRVTSSPRQRSVASYELRPSKPDVRPPENKVVPESVVMDSSGPVVGPGEQNKVGRGVQHIHVRMDEAFVRSVGQPSGPLQRLAASHGLVAEEGVKERLGAVKTVKQGCVDELLAMLDTAVEKKNHYLAELENLGTASRAAL